MKNTKLLTTLTLLVLSGYISIRATQASSEEPQSEYELTQSLLSLAESNPKDAGESLSLIQKHLDHFTANVDTLVIPQKRKAALLHSNLNRLDNFLWENISYIPKGLFNYFHRKVKQSRYELSQYQRFSNHSELPDADAFAEKFLAQARSRAAWASTLAWGIQPIVDWFY